MKEVKIVENGVEAKKVIEQFISQGYSKDEVYLLAHDKKRSDDLTEAIDTSEIGLSEQGVMDTVANVFRTRGDELRSKLESLGLSTTEAQQFEKELDRGRVVVVASNKAS